MKTLKVSVAITGEGVNQTSVFDLANNAIARREIPNEEFPDTAEDVQLDVDIVRAKTSLLSIRSTVDVAVAVNDAVAPVSTINLNAGEGLLWFDGIGYDLADLLPADVTALYFTNAGEVAGSVEVIQLFDATANE